VTTRSGGKILIDAHFANDIDTIFGVPGEIVERTDEFAPAFERAIAATQATVIELRVGNDSFGPDTSLSGLRIAAE